MRQAGGHAQSKTTLASAGFPHTMLQVRHLASVVMREFISLLNLVVAVGMTVLMMLDLITAPSIQSILQFVACVSWILCAVWLRRSRELWPWVGCVILVSAVTLIWGAELLESGLGGR
jgi:hypothetical protein